MRPAALGGQGKRLPDLADALWPARGRAPAQEPRAASDELLAQVDEPGTRTRSIAAHSAPDGLRDVAIYEGAAMLVVGRTHMLEQRSVFRIEVGDGFEEIP